MWYGNEIITHHDTIVQGEVDFNTCVTIHLRDITHEVSAIFKFIQNREKFMIDLKMLILRGSLSSNLFYYMNLC